MAQRIAMVLALAVELAASSAVGALQHAILPSASSVPLEAVTAVDTRVYTREGQLIPVEGRRRLNLLCMGLGSPVVVLESGAGDGAASWRRVQAEIAKSTRVCAYDRAGYGFSDPSGRPADARNAVADLHALLKEAGLHHPVVLVGHSVGGLYAELFAATYPRQIAGMVLVDPTGLDDFRLVKEIISDEERVQQRRNFLKRSANYAHCLDLAQRGDLVASLAPECAPSPTGDPVLDKEARRQMAQPKYWQTFQSEMTNFLPQDHPVGTDSVITAQVRSRPLRLGRKPFVVIKTPGGAPPGKRGERLRAESGAVAERLVTASTRGKLVQVASGHYVQLEHPDLVVGPIREVLEAVRN